MEIHKLSKIAVGHTCSIVNICNNHCGEDNLLLKLMEFGLLPGEYLTILHKCSRSGPICVHIHGHQSSLSLRLDEADRIEVKIIHNFSTK